MNLQKQTLIQFNNLFVKYSDIPILDNISGSVCVGSKIGLIGINGTGKSTLLKCIGNISKPNSGDVFTNSTIEYIPQLDLDLYRSDMRLFEYLEDQHDDWWLVFEQYENLFGSQLSESRIVSTLSGGEIVKLNIATALSKSPHLLLLDEPTNHLDLMSLQQLENVLINTSTAFVVVSHNIDFLNSVVNTIWELDKGKLNVFGGNYDFYHSEKKRILQSQFDQFVVVRKKIRGKKEALLNANVRFQKKLGKLKRMAKTNDRSIPKIARNGIKMKVEKGFGINKVKKKSAIEDLTNDLNKLKMINRKNVYLELCNEKKSGLMVSFEKCTLILPNQVHLIDDINFTIHHGDKIAILGNNGSGKTTFVNQLVYEEHDLLMGTVKYGLPYITLFVDQKYKVVNPEKTILENMQSSNKNINYENIRRILSNLGFSFKYNIKVKASTLSGGETVRLAFAMATSSNIDLLILDEPTNNLDIETVRVISESLCKFRGTLIVISHDIPFLKNINTGRVYVITDKRINDVSLDNLQKLENMNETIKTNWKPGIKISKEGYGKYSF